MNELDEYDFDFNEELLENSTDDLYDGWNDSFDKDKLTEIIEEFCF